MPLLIPEALGVGDSRGEGDAPQGPRVGRRRKGAGF